MGGDSDSDADRLIAIGFCSLITMITLLIYILTCCCCC